jgi:hypothetical protein
MVWRWEATMRTAGIVTAVTLVGTGLCAQAAVADKGGVPHEGSNGQGRQEQPAAAAPGTPAAPVAAQPVKAKPKPKPKPKHAAKARPSKSAAPAKPAPPRGQAKTTICHHTGSKSNPWVTITIANPALAAHRRHGDLIPAPAGGCPKAAAAPAPEPEPEPSSPASPSTIEEPDAGGPLPVIVTLPVTRRARSESSSATGAVLASRAQDTSAAPAAGGRVLTTRISAPRAATASAAVTPVARQASGRMPYTGLMAWLVMVAGAGALLAGVALRRAHGVRRR